ncbi:MAG: sel1 repeat family protein [Vampirovibrio sp.]|nr:sel1 repeat family protein [Vampirovibrio sp.]
MGKNSNFALKWYKKAAQQGCAFANYKIGWFYSDQNKFKEAIPYLEKAAQQGSPNGLVTLGVRYMVGKGVKKDEAKGLALWKQASEKGFGYAYLFIGNAYYHGNGVNVDKALAFQYYDKYASQDDDYAHQNVVANFYLAEGGFINWVKGWYWKSVSLTNQIRDLVLILQGKTPKFLEGAESC